MPGLGWMLTSRLYKEELEPSWPTQDKVLVLLLSCSNSETTAVSIPLTPPEEFEPF